MTEQSGWATPDLDRLGRTGDPEVVYGAGKSPAQIVGILKALHGKHPERAVMATRLSDEAMDVLAETLASATLDRAARAVTLGPIPDPSGTGSPRPTA